MKIINNFRENREMQRRIDAEKQKIYDAMERLKEREMNDVIHEFT